LFKRAKHFFTFLFVVGFATNIYSTHIVGGELYYDYIGNNKYVVTLKLYRDCLNGQPNFGGLGEGEAILNVSNINKELAYQFLLGSPIVSKVPANTNNPCMKAPLGVCVEEGVYTKTITLPPIAGGYFLTYETCCRNTSILNLVSPGSQGSAYQTYVPGPEMAAGNSSPRFDAYPSLYVCQGKPINFSHTATDPDGDSLVYSLQPAYNGLGAFVNYKTPYNGFNPMSASPPLSINPSSGDINGTPNLLGQWVVCIEVKEYRNGVLINTHYRDFQYNVISCVLTIIPGIADQVNKCSGNTITFQNQSYSNFGLTYLWNFGVADSISDTSNVVNPNYTYPDTGKYVVTLVLNPGLPCADSVKKTIYVYPKFDPTFNIPTGPQCIKSNTMQFNITGNYAANATFTSYFGATALPSISSQTNNTVVYPNPGVYPIKIYGKQFICSDSLIDSLVIIDRPITKIIDFPTSLCDPGVLTFTNGSYSEYPCQTIWNISNGSVYYESDPTHIFSPPGNYSVTLTLLRWGVCPDTVTSPVHVITVFPSPNAEFVFTPSITSIFDPEISFESYAYGAITNLVYDFGDGATSTYFNDKHIYQSAGTYVVKQTVTNVHNCKDEKTKILEVLPEFRFWVPNAFTPGYDDLNDVFIPTTIGVSNYKMEIYNRFGEKLFTTEDLKQGWDGMYKGQPCKQDVYIWKARFKNEVTKKIVLETGHVSLFNQQ